MDLALFGIQGSGKGTQAKIMSERYNLVIFETGEICRSLAKEKSKLGLKIQDFVEKGNLVPAHIIMEIVDHFVGKTPADRGIIFDGFPRNTAQQHAFDAVLKKWNRDFLAINIRLSKKVTVKRLLARGRHDDIPEIITNRIKIFLKETSPVIASYRKKNKVIEINGDQSIENVAIEMENKLDQYFLKTPHKILARRRK
jgi:adenylate kinase